MRNSEKGASSPLGKHSGARSAGSKAERQGEDVDRIVSATRGDGGNGGLLLLPEDVLAVDDSVDLFV